MMHAGYPGQRIDSRTAVDCKYYLEGRCTQGDKCPFRHHPEKFNTAARVGQLPRSLPQICYFYINGQCNKGDKCAYQHPALDGVLGGTRASSQTHAETLSHIDLEEDESPRIPGQQRAAKVATPPQAPAPAQQPSVRKQLQQAPAQPSRLQPPPHQPLQNRLGGPAPTQRRLNGVTPSQAQPRQAAPSEQDGAEQSQGNVFDRLGRAKPNSALNRLSAPPQVLGSNIAVGTRQQAGASVSGARSQDDADRVIAIVNAKALVGRKEAEMIKSGALPARTLGQGSRRSPDALEPVSVSNRRSVAVLRGGPPASAPVHAPKFASPVVPGSNPAGPARKSALDRIARPHQNGSPAGNSANSPAIAPKPRRATLEPYSTARSRTSTVQPPPSVVPAASDTQPSATTSAAPQASDATQGGPSTAGASAPEQATAGLDRRGRQKISWQPPTQAQRDEAIQESRMNISKRKAAEPAELASSHASLPDTDPSPPKRIKPDADKAQEQATPTEQPAISGKVHEQPDSAAALDMDEDPTDAAEQDLQPVENAVQEGMDQIVGEDEAYFVDEFDDEAAMRELEALS